MAASHSKLISWRVAGPTTLHGFDDDLVYIEVCEENADPDRQRQIALVSAWDMEGERFVPMIAALPKLLAACQAVVANWEHEQLGQAARLCAEAVNAALGQPATRDSHAEQLLLLVAKAKAANMAAEDLDEVVHDMAASMASNVNNSGTDGQLAFLLGEMGYDGTSTRLDELAEIMGDGDL